MSFNSIAAMSHSEGLYEDPTRQRLESTYRYVPDTPLEKEDGRA